MKLKVIIEENTLESWLEIHANRDDKNILSLIDKLSNIDNFNEKKEILFSGRRGAIVTLLKPESIIRFYSLEKKVYAETDEGDFQIKHYLYEIEEILNKNSLDNFFRISNSEIVNSNFIKNLDMGLVGKIFINFKNEKYSIVSRRYTSKICKKLNIK